MSDFEGIIEHETPKAWLARIGGKEMWLPKSQVKASFEADGTYIFAVPDWLANKKGLTPSTPKPHQNPDGSLQDFEVVPGSGLMRSDEAFMENAYEDMHEMMHQNSEEAQRHIRCVVNGKMRARKGQASHCPACGIIAVGTHQNTRGETCSQNPQYPYYEDEADHLERRCDCGKIAIFYSEIPVKGQYHPRYESPNVVLWCDECKTEVRN